MQELYLLVDIADLKRTIGPFMSNHKKHFTLRKSSLSFASTEKKIDLKEEAIINFIILPVKFSSKSWKNSGSMLKTKNSQIKEGMKKLSKP